MENWRAGKQLETASASFVWDVWFDEQKGDRMVTAEEREKHEHVYRLPEGTRKEGKFRKERK